MNKSENLKILISSGFFLKIFNPGQYYNLEEKTGNIKLKLSFKINKGLITTYLYVHINDEKIMFEHSNFAFIYRFLINDMDAETKAPKFRDYVELKTVTFSIINIYEV